MTGDPFKVFWLAGWIDDGRIKLIPQPAASREEAVAIAARHPGAVAMFRPLRPAEPPRRDDF